VDAKPSMTMKTQSVRNN